MEQNKNEAWEVKEFPAYAPRALSGIGTDILDRTTKDRTFMVQMVPQKTEERREKFLTIDPEIMEDATILKGAIVVWAEHRKEAVSETYRQMNFPYIRNFRDRTIDISSSLAAILETAYENHPKLVQARRAFIKAIALTREEKADKTLRDMHIMRTLLSLPSENEDPIIGMASELAERCRAAGEEVSEEEISGVLSKHGFKKKSKRLGGEPRKRYVFDRERLRDILGRLAGSGLDGEGA